MFYINAFIHLLPELYLEITPFNIMAPSLSTHYKNVYLNQSKEDAIDDSSILSENEGIDIRLPVKYPYLSAKRMVYCILRGYRGLKDTYLLRHSHKNELWAIFGSARS